MPRSNFYSGECCAMPGAACREVSPPVEDVHPKELPHLTIPGE
jgi:hypothetical protein